MLSALLLSRKRKGDREEKRKFDTRLGQPEHERPRSTETTKRS